MGGHQEARMPPEQSSEVNGEKVCIAFGPEHLNPLQKVIKFVAATAFFLYNFDPMNIYKLSRGQPSIFREPGLRVELKPIDRWKKRWGYVMRSLVFESQIRVLSVLLLRLESESGRKQDRDRGQFYHRALALIEQLFKDPLAPISEVSLLLYGSVAVAMTYCIGYLPYLNTKEPLNSMSLRFMMEPEREVKRIDMVLERKLDQFLSSTGVHYANQLTAFSSSKTVSFRHPNLVSEFEMFRSSQRKIVLDQYSCIWKLRPVAYTATWYFALYNFSVPIFVMITIAVIITTANFPQILLSSVLERRCANLGASSCELGDVYTWQDWASFMELLTLMLLSAHMVLLMCVSLFTHARGQVLMSKEIKQDLRECVNELQLANESLPSAKYTLGSQMDETRHQEARVDASSFRTLIKVSVAMQEIKTNIFLITQFLEALIAVAGVALAVALIVGGMEGSRVASIRFVVLWWAWFGGNSLTLTCAYVFARTIESEKVGWSILAQNFLRSRRLNRRLDEDSIATGWLKLVQSGIFSDTRNSARPYGVSVTFRRVLEINFFIASVISLLRSF